MRKPKSSGIQKQEDLVKEYEKVITYYIYNTKQSFRDLKKILGVSRDRISYHINRYQILKALNKLNDEKYLAIIEELPVSTFKGLTTLRTKDEKDILKFCTAFGEDLKNFTANDWKQLNLMCDYYWSGQIQNYADFEKIMAAVKVKRQKSQKKLLKTATVSIGELIDIQEKLRAENEKLRMCLKLHGIDINDCELLQQKIEFED